MEFYKAHGLANDFIIINAMAAVDYRQLAREICARHTSVGADGLLVLALDDKTAQFSLRFFNSDGSEAEMSGNGIRCAAAVLYETGRAHDERITITTRAGVKTLILEGHTGTHYDFTVMVGQPGFKPAEIPIHIDEELARVVAYPLVISDQETITITALSTGNPHCTIFVEDFNQLDWRRLGACLECHSAFPNRSNVEFVRILSRNKIEARFWERGAGETESSGTGSCAAAIAAMINGYTDRRVDVQTPAGELTVAWQDDAGILLTGPAEIVCQGHYFFCDKRG
ncbi:MAG: diaminopimelate epimerase [Acidobacteriota bacterium]